MNTKKYKPSQTIDYPEREWPGRQLTKAPVWCSVDLRDGNQALTEPMVIEEKIEFFNMLVRLGFKEIEVGCPGESQTEFDFLRQLVERRMIPDDVSVQVLTQCRDHLIRKTFDAIGGIKNVIVHIYNSTSPKQREVVLGKTREETVQVAVHAAELVREFAEGFNGNLTLEYSPEGFTETEPDFSLAICTAVQEAWGQSTPEHPIILNLPGTVEVSTPNIYADLTEFIGRHLKNRDSVILSVHPHNDRGTAVAAAELAMLAGAQRVEGTLFGNGERTGNVDIMTLACNLFSQGVDPELDISDIKQVAEVYERCTHMDIPPRHPYAGSLVFTAFSGSHQDAITKGMQDFEENKDGYWEVPYLLIDPKDIGRTYQPVVRINSQSAKEGAAYILETFYGFKLPKGMVKEFSDIIRGISDRQGEVVPEQIMNVFRENYIQKKEPLHFRKLRITDTEVEPDEFATLASVTYTFHGIEKVFEGVGNGPIDAVQHGMEETLGIKIKVLDYDEHALSAGSGAQAVSYIHLMDENSVRTTYGVGISSNITRSSVRALFSAVNRLFYS